MQRFFVFPVLLLLFGFRTVHAQQFGGNPPSTEWMEINNDSLRVIFPRGMERQAQRVANTIMYENRHNRGSIGNKELKLNLVLQNRTVTSNGFVTLSPFHAVFQTMPPSDNFSLGSMNWLQELSLHEYRHALQNMNFRSGIGRVFYDIFGENGQAFISNLLIPDWFWEGDAVFMETSLSDQGRGRLPSFLEPFKSLYLSGKHYSYAKIRNGSYRDMVPDHYPLGYMMSAYGRDTLGLYFWEMVTQEALLNHQLTKVINEKYRQRPFHPFKYGIYPLSSALKYFTGYNIKGFYHHSLSYFSKQWQKNADDHIMTYPVNVIKNNHRTLTNYRYPYWLPDGNILAINEGYNRLPRIIEIDTSGETRTIVQMGNIQSDYYSYANHHLVWTEMRPDARWGWVEYSVIRIYDMNTHRAKTLSHHSRYFSPALSADASKIVTVQVTPGNQTNLLIIDVHTGKVTDTLSNPDHYYYTYPVFSLNDRFIISAVRDESGKMALIKQSVLNHDIEVLTPFTHKPVGPPVPGKNYIFFPAAFSDNVQLYALKKQHGHLYQIAERPLGNYSVTADPVHHRLIFDEYAATGYHIDSIPLNPAAWRPVDTTPLSVIRNPFVPEALKAEGGEILTRIPDHIYPVTKYNGIKHLVNIHSWSFLPAYPDVGIYLQSQNVLNTLQWNAGGGYNFNENSPFIAANLAYGALFPIFQLGYATHFNRSGYINQDTTVMWNETNFSAGFTIPLSLSSNLYNRSLSFGATFNTDALKFQPSTAIKRTTADVNYLEESLSFSNGRITTVQQVYPKFGQSISLDFQHTVNQIFARQFTGNLAIFFPGLFRNNSLYFIAAFSEKDNKKQYKFTDNFLYPNGYSAVPYQKIYMLGINYQFPLTYPDWGTTWAYLLRLRLETFFDYSHAGMLPGIHPANDIFRSVGATLYLDTRLFTDQLLIPIGIRYSYLLDRDLTDPGRRGRVEITVPVSFF